VRIEKPFYLARFEVTNEQYRRFDPEHDSGYVSVFNKDQSTRGEPVNGDRQPAVRVSWRQAVAFCEWASRRAGRRVRLPTEAQWEYACRAGAASALAYGNADADFGAQANLADERLNALTRGDSPKWIPAVMTVNDGATVTAAVGKYPANAWGLCDMHGNAAEWTASVYRPYPCADGDGRDAPDADGPRVVRGGSFYDRPARARASFRLAFPTWQRLAMVGFRVVCEPTDDDKAPPRVASVP
jgi:formylglycine-generating enzyme required for sulfatase activity